MNTPSELKYTKDHEWVSTSDGLVRVGITDYAQDALGDIVYVKLPDVGSSLELHSSVAEIESTKSVNDVYAPVTGTVARVNEALGATPELVNTDPYGEGWLFEVSDAVIDPTVLMTAEEYASLVGG